MKSFRHLKEIAFSPETKRVKNTEYGLFVDENSLDHMITKLQRHLVMGHDTREELREDIKEELMWNNKYYFCENGSCSAGYLIPGETSSRLPLSKGELYPCQNVILKNDPRFNNESPIEIIDDKGLFALFDVKRNEYKVENHAFDKFVERLDESKRMKEQLGFKFPIDLRDKLSLLYKFFKPSSEVERDFDILRTMKYGFEEGDYRSNEGWIFVIARGNRLRTCYDVGDISKYGFSRIKR